MYSKGVLTLIGMDDVGNLINMIKWHIYVREI